MLTVGSVKIAVLTNGTVEQATIVNNVVSVVKDVAYAANAVRRSS